MPRTVAALILILAALWPASIHAAGARQITCKGFQVTVPGNWVSKGEPCPNVVYNTNDAGGIGLFQTFVGYHKADSLDALQTIVANLAGGLGDLERDPQADVRRISGIRFVIGANRTTYRTPSNPLGTTRFVQQALTVCKGVVYEFVGEVLDTTSPLSPAIIGQLATMVNSIHVSRSCGVPTPPPAPTVVVPQQPTQAPAPSSGTPQPTPSTPQATVSGTPQVTPGTPQATVSGTPQPAATSTPTPYVGF